MSSRRRRRSAARGRGAAGTPRAGQGCWRRGGTCRPGRPHGADATGRGRGAGRGSSDGCGARPCGAWLSPAWPPSSLPAGYGCGARLLTPSRASRAPPSRDLGNLHIPQGTRSPVAYNTTPPTLRARTMIPWPAGACIGSRSPTNCRSTTWRMGVCSSNIGAMSRARVGRATDGGRSALPQLTTSLRHSGRRIRRWRLGLR